MMPATFPDASGLPPEPIRCRELTAGLRYRLTLVLYAPQERQAVADLLRGWAETAPASVRCLSLSPADAGSDHLLAQMEALVIGDDGGPAAGRTPDERLTDLINAPMAWPQDLALVLMGVTVGTSAEAVRLLERFVDYLPPHVHLTLVVAAMPPLTNLARLRVRRQLLEIDWRGDVPPSTRV